MGRRRSGERLRFLLVGKSDRTFGAERLRTALAPTVVFLTIPAVHDFYRWLSFLVPVPTLFAWLRTRRGAAR